MRHIFAMIVLVASAQAQELVVGPYLQSARPTSIWIAWESSSGDESVVEWGLDEALGERSEGHAHAGFGFSRHHEVQLTELEPATTYFYRVRTGDLVGEIHHFATPPTDESEAPTRLVAMSDMQRDGAHPNVFRELVREGVIPTARAQFGDDLAQALSLALVPGDLVENGLFYGQWADQFFNPAQPLFQHIPIYPVLGNHEVNTDFYFDYFKLPENGTPGFEEHWWWFDHSNVRIIGLDSNFGFQIDVQLEWLDGVLVDACAEDNIDFVFVQLHHPFHSELWIDGNTDYTGDVIQRLESFSTDCAKPSVHFFGHTHGYSRGHSQDHNHLMVNVATAGGSIDRWGEHRQRDYPEYTVSQDEYGFVFVEVLAGDDPLFRLQRLSRGQPGAGIDNELTDEVLIRANNTPPNRPVALGALDEANPACFAIALRRFVDADGDGHQATQWQVARDCEFDGPVVDRWRQSENQYREVDSQAEDDLLDEVFEGLDADAEYCWRARVRDTGMVWSEWSDPARFRTGGGADVALPLVNPDAEQGIDGWRVEEGIFESVEDGECAGGEPFDGRHHFSVGGVCDHSERAIVSQLLDLSDHAAAIDDGELGVRFGGQLRTWNGSDRPDLWVRFLSDEEVLAETPQVGTRETEWTLVTDHAPVPPGARAVELVLRGRRNSGTDNDSYFDELFVQLAAGNDCDPAPEDPIEPDAGLPDAAVSDAGVADAFADGARPDATVAQDAAPDAGLADGASPDVRRLDATLPDSGAPEAAVLDAARPADGPLDATRAIDARPADSDRGTGDASETPTGVRLAAPRPASLGLRCG